MRGWMMAVALFPMSLVCVAERPTFTLEASALTHYVWRGVLLTNGPVLQNSATVAWRGAHVNVFTNHDLDRVNRVRGNVSELDYDAGYDRAKGRITFSGGITGYSFPHTSVPSATELYAGAAIDAPLHPSVRGYFDVASIRGSYVTFDVSHGVALPKLGQRATWEAALAAGVGLGSANHNEAYFGVKRLAPADLHPTAALPITIGKLKLTPKLGYSMMLDSELRRGPAAKAHGFFGGITLTLTL